MTDREFVRDILKNGLKDAGFNLSGLKRGALELR
jgi:hypothetical protein